MIIMGYVSPVLHKKKNNVGILIRIALVRQF